MRQRQQCGGRTLLSGLHRKFSCLLGLLPSEVGLPLLAISCSSILGALPVPVVWLYGKQTSLPVLLVVDVSQMGGVHGLK